MKPIFETYFQNYKNVLNSFIVKIAGDKSEFALHQDSTSCDESKYSPLSLWIPLQDTNIDNGTLCVVPKTHQVFSNYRGVSIQPDYYKYEEEIRKYLMPIQLKAGDILVFDNRLVHYSPANKSKNDRIVVMCGLFDKEATFRICYQENKNEPIDIYHQADDFLLTFKGFHIGCDCRPETGVKVDSIVYDSTPITKDKFVDFVNSNNLIEYNHAVLQKLNLNSYTVIDSKYKTNLKEIINDKIQKISTKVFQK